VSERAEKNEIERQERGRKRSRTRTRDSVCVREKEKLSERVREKGDRARMFAQKRESKHACDKERRYRAKEEILRQ